MVAHGYNPQNIHIYDGMVNYVGIVDEKVVVKVPKSRNSASGLVVEAATLELLESRPSLPVATPRLIKFSTHPTYLVSTYLPGNIVGEHELKKLSGNEREILGRDIGTYVLAQATEVDIDAVRRHIPQPGEGDSWGELFQEGVGDFSSRAFPSLTSLASVMHSRWIPYYDNRAETQFTQGDLRLGNMAVSATNRLAGVFDFGRAGLGDASYEINPLANIDTTILNAVIDELESNGVEICRDHIQLWDVMKDILKLTYAVKGKAKPSFYKKALAKIPAQYPELNWSELGQLEQPTTDSGIHL